MFLIAKGMTIAASSLLAIWVGVWATLACLGVIWEVPPAKWEKVVAAVALIALLCFSYVLS